MKSTRKAVYDKYNGKCAYCGCDLNGKFHVDHFKPVIRKFKIIPQHFEGEEFIPYKKVADGFEKPELDCFENYMPACVSCNINKRSYTLEGFRRFISGFITSLNRDSTQYKIAKRYGLIKEEINPVIFYFEKVELRKSEDTVLI